MSHQHDGHESPPSFWSSRYAIGYVAIGAVAAYFLFDDDSSPVLRWTAP